MERLIKSLVAFLGLYSSMSLGALVGISTDSNLVFSIDPTTGASSLIGPSGGNYAGVGASYLDGTLYATDLLVHIGDPWDVRLASIDLGTGTSTSINDQGGSLNWPGLASDEGAGYLHTIDIDSGVNQLKRIETDGRITSIGSGAGVDGRGMAYDDANSILYATHESGGLYTIDTATGNSTLIGNTGIITSWIGLAFDENLGILYANTVDPDGPNGRAGSLYTLDIQTGVASFIGVNSDNFIDGLAWTPDVALVPIPATVWLFASALGAFGCLGKRKAAT